MQDRKKKLLQIFSLKIIITSFVFVACVMCFAMIVDEVLIEHEKIFDNTVFSFFDSVTTCAYLRRIMGI